MDKITHIKTLRSYTIIPNELYVERAADAQLQRTIMDMGRPGYILVARQMGKTNLLLYTKRRLSNSVDKFLYIDISNTFYEIRHFFQNIIDTFLDSYPEIDKETIKSIRDRRNIFSHLPPHKEHENELRQIIQKIRGKLVICLDEIDALTKTDYSDQVFSFIRSTYFSGRVNFPEFQRLTYVLSGVAESSELIKDKALSPFNIGEKIYLNDFSYEEFNTFLKKAKLPFHDKVIERIYYWTSGNPRLSWDLCSSLEEAIQDGKEISVATVDNTVKGMYLSNFDLPPIDHIRTLVEEDRVVRDAIMAIHYGKSETISDAVRNRLYLSGITKPDQSGSRKIEIRNRLLVESLSENWIQDVEKRMVPTYELANKQYCARRYEEALNLYNEYIASTNNPEDSTFLYFKIGHCLFELKRYLDAIHSFETHPIKREQFPSLYYSIQHYLGLSHLLSGKNEKSADFFKKIMDEQNPNDNTLYFYFDSCLNLSSILFSNFENNIDEIKRLNEIVINFEKKVRNSAEDNKHANYLLNIAHYNLSRVFKSLDDINSARREIEAAIQVADDRTKVFLIIEASDLLASEKEKKELLEVCLQNIIDEKLTVAPRNIESQLDFTADVSAKLASRLSENSNDSELDKLIIYLQDTKIPDNTTTGDILYKAAFYSLTRGNSEAFIKLINKALPLAYSNQNSEFRRQLITLWFLSCPFSQTEHVVMTYFANYIEPPESKFIESDLRLTWELVQKYLSINRIDIAEDITTKIRNLMEKTWDKSLGTTFHKLNAGRVIIDTLDLFIDSRMELNRKQYIDFHKRIKNLLSRFRNKKYKIINIIYFPNDWASEISNILIDISDHIIPASKNNQGLNKYSPNDKIKVRFRDGTKKEGKYKLFKNQLKNGQCQIIDN